MKIPYYSFGFTFLILLVFHPQALYAELTLLQSYESSLSTSTEAETESPLVVTAVVMQPVIISDVSPSTNLEIEDPVLVLDSGDVAIEGKLLNYPNPFSFSNGQTSIGYFLTKSGDIRLQIFSLTGYLLYTADFAKDTAGAQGNTYNRIQLDKFSFGSAVLSPGVYIYTIIHNGKLLGKNKMVVLP